jgi:hypothetical protein
MAIVYQHRRLDTNEIFYIGIGKTKSRSKSKKSRNPYWWNIINKTDYIIEILYSSISWEEACEIEMGLIKLYGRKDMGTGVLVNMTDGGEGSIGHTMPQESKDSISRANKGKKRTEEQKKHLSEIITGENNPNYGNRWSDEQKENAKYKSLQWLETNEPVFKGRQHSEESKIVMRDVKLGKKHKEETINLYKTTRKGSNNACSKLTEENVIWIRQEYAINKTSTYKLAEMFNVSRPVISSVIKRKTWKHV